jgi:ribonuclease H / adenosylcobalamin/alpha-ribazole phosphatase
MANFLLIRHASCVGLGERINGRTPGICLNAKGRHEAEQLADRLRDARITAIFSSPLERAQETAAIIAGRLKSSWHPDEALNEIDYGQWTGKALQELQTDPAWQHFNACRCSAQIPGGESMEHVRQRARDAIDHLRKLPTKGAIAVISHADWIRSAVSECTRISLDLLKSFQVDPASLMAMRVEDWGSLILRWNDTGSLKEIF